MEGKMSIGEKRLFSSDTATEGCTYREWLIGMIAASPSGKPSVTDPGPFADACVKIADAIVRRLDAEQK